MAGYSISNNNCYMIRTFQILISGPNHRVKVHFKKPLDCQGIYPSHFATCTNRITGGNFKMTANYHSFPSSPKQAARAHLLHHMSATKTKMQDKLFHVSATKIKDKLNSKVADM